MQKPENFILPDSNDNQHCKTFVNETKENSSRSCIVGQPLNYPLLSSVNASAAFGGTHREIPDCMIHTIKYNFKNFF